MNSTCQQNIILNIQSGEHSYQIPLNNEQISFFISENVQVHESTSVLRDCQLKGKHFKLIGEQYSSQLDELNQRGFNQRPKRSLIALKKHNGDVDAACAWLEQTCPQNEKRNNQKQSELELKGKHFQELAVMYSTQLAEITERGFNQKPRRSLIALKKHNGNVDAACAWLEQTCPQNGKGNHQKHGNRGNHQQNNQPSELKGKHFKQLEEQFSAQVAELNQRGFDRPRRNLIALKKHNGDVDAACAWLEQTCPQNGKQNHPQHSAEHGFDRLRRNLKKHNGNIRNSPPGKPNQHPGHKHVHRIVKKK